MIGNVAAQSEVAPAGAASHEQMWPDQFLLASNARFVVILALMLFDILAAIAALHVIAEQSVAEHLASMGFADAGAAAAGLVFANICGLSVITSSGDLRRSVTGVVGFGTLLLSGVVIVVAPRSGLTETWRILVGLLCGIFVAGTGRLACALLVTYFPNRFIERVLVVGTRLNTSHFFCTSRINGERVKVVGQIVVGSIACPPALATRIEGAELLKATDLASRPLPKCTGLIVVLKAGLDDAYLSSIARGLEAVSVPVHVLAETSESLKRGLFPNNVNWLLQNAPLTPGSMLAKRILDVILSSVGILLLAPLLLLVAAAIRIDTHGPALFRQVRLGRGNQSFTVFKFRTMAAAADGSDGSVQAIQGDPRITRVGRILRRSSLDELPQLFNVINGTMSLVGPRPHPTALNRRFAPLIDGYSMRHRMAPGMTGWAQVNGSRGETRSVDQMQQRVDLDLEYIRSHSLGFDLWILVRTVLAVVLPHNAY